MLLTFVMGFHRWSVDSPHKGLVMRKLFLFDDAIMVLHDFFYSSMPYWWLSLSLLGKRTTVTRLDDVIPITTSAWLNHWWREYCFISEGMLYARIRALNYLVVAKLLWYEYSIKRINFLIGMVPTGQNANMFAELTWIKLTWPNDNFMIVISLSD